jgi:carnosine N-methyltransferase
MEEESAWAGLENGIEDQEELQVIYRTLDSYQ